MPRSRRSPATERRRLDELVEHPYKRVFFGDLSEHDLAALADDIRRNGLRQPIQVLPRNKAGLKPNTIMDGHQRRRALVLNGVEVADVEVRYDLADADTAAVEQAFLEPNQNRRQLDPLAKARVALRLFEIENKRPRGQLRHHDLAEARDRVGRVIGMSGRNLNRYFRLLRTPTEVQDAFRAGALLLVTAEKVCDLDGETQKRIADRIRGGETPKEVVADHVGGRDGRHRRANDALAAFHRNLTRALHDLDGRLDSLSPFLIARFRPELERAAAVIHQLLIGLGDTNTPEHPRDGSL